ncbi:transposase [Agrobacterium salinitolerans]|uniref:transposase n=1 Tax=Agrobacterium salinitolerans TaxID=1183413 RepID=UPI003A5C84E8
MAARLGKSPASSVLANSSASSRSQPRSACDFKAYKDRNRIERMFNRLKQFRRIATRYDKTRKSFEAFLVLASVKLWLPFIHVRAF